MTDPATLINEIAARFWAQTGHKPNQQPDPSNPEDKKMAPALDEIEKKVKSEDATGTLTTTFDHPEVVQNLSDAAVADQAAAGHMLAAASATDPDTKQKNIDAANAAIDVSLSKTQAASAVQPASVSPETLAKLVPTSAPKTNNPHDHVAHIKRMHHSRQALYRMLVREADARMWAQTHFRPGQTLDPNNPTDQRMLRVWMDIFQKVQREFAEGRLRLTYNHPVVAQNLHDAHIADRAAIMHREHAEAMTDPQLRQRAFEESARAHAMARHKSREAARHQPPTASPAIARTAARSAPPPPAGAPAGEHVAHEQAQDAADHAANTQGAGTDGGKPSEEGLSTGAKIGIGVAVAAGIYSVVKIVRSRKTGPSIAIARAPRLLPGGA